MTDGDVIALSMLGIMVIALVTLLGIMISLYRNAGKRDELAELVDDDELKKTPPEEKREREEWERDADWWKSSRD